MKIMLCCSDGMSTSLLVEKMKLAAQARNISPEIWAISLALLPSYKNENQPDVVMLGPQIKYKLKSIIEMYKDTNVKVIPIDMRDYGAMRGDKVLDCAISALQDS